MKTVSFFSLESKEASKNFLCGLKMSDFLWANCVRLGPFEIGARLLVDRKVMTHQAQTRNSSKRKIRNLQLRTTEKNFDWHGAQTL